MKAKEAANNCVSGIQSGLRIRLVRWCLTALLWLAATRPAQGFGHHIMLAGKACPLPTQVFHCGPGYQRHMSDAEL